MGSRISQGDLEWSGEYDSYKESPIPEFGKVSDIFIGEVLEGSRRFTGPEGEWSMNVSWISGMIESCPRSLGWAFARKKLSSK